MEETNLGNRDREEDLKMTPIVWISCGLLVLGGLIHWLGPKYSKLPRSLVLLKLGSAFVVATTGIVLFTIFYVSKL